MKSKIILIAACLLGIFANPIYAREKLRKLNFGTHLKELNISARSDSSFEHAMNRLSIMMPDGYALASVKYFKDKGVYIVLAKLIRI
jgi:hypothetical protein